MAALLELDGLTKSFGQTTAVDGLDLAIEDGEFVVLLGPSGCGKTTTLRMIAGFERPTGGRIVVDGSPLSSADRVVPPERRQMGMMFQSYAVWPHMTVRQNVAYGLKIQKLPKQDVQDGVDRALETVHMGEYAERYPAELSGGQQQRVALARALAVRPTILLMDEPLSNLDAKLREEMRGELHRLHAELGFTTVYVTHDQAEAMALADRIVVLRDGTVQQVGSPGDLYLRPANAFVAGFLGRANIVPGVAVSDGVMRIGDRELAGTNVRDTEPGSAVSGIVRPVGVEIVDDDVPASRTVFDCVVAEQMFLGESIEVVLRVPDLGTDVLATFSPYTQLRDGAGLRCRLRGTVIVEGGDGDAGADGGDDRRTVGDAGEPVAAG